MASQSRASGIDRRTLLKLLGVAGTGAVLQACGSGATPSPATPTTASQAQATAVPATPTAQQQQSLVIAFFDEINTLDPHKVSRNLTQLSPHKAIWDQFLAQDRDLTYQPHVVKAWEWASDDKTTLALEVQEGVTFHNGDTLTAEDLQFSFERMATEGFAYATIWGNIESIDIDDEYNMRLNLGRYDPSIVSWLGFLNSLVIPKNYFEEVGEEGFLEQPVGSGPYKFKEFVAGSHLALEAYEDYWKGAAPIKEVTFRIVTDSTARAAEIEAGTADFTLEVPIADFDRLSSLEGLKGIAQPVTDVAVLFVAPYVEALGDEGVRLALHHAIDKDSLVENVLLGFGEPLDTTEAPLYDAYPEGYEFPYDPDRARELLDEAGYSPDNPLNLTVFSTRGFKTRDFEVMQAIVGMWSQVGVEAEIETVTIPQFFELRNAAQLESLALYFWSNPTGDPINSVGLSNWPPSPFSAFKGEVDHTGLKEELTETLNPVFTETDEEARIEAAKEGAKYVVEHGLMIPLYQVVSPIVMKTGLEYEPYPQGWILPYEMDWA